MSITERIGNLEGQNLGKETQGQSPLTIFFEDERARDKSLVGGKGYGLHLLKSIPEIAKKVPDGFIITAPVYDQVIQANPQIQTSIRKLDEYSASWIKAKLTKDEKAALELEQKVAVGGENIRKELENVMLLPKLENVIVEGYDKLCAKVGIKDLEVAVRSSGNQEDGLENSFAGQNKTELHRKGKDQVITSVKNCIASQFELRAISYRNFERLKRTLEALKTKPEDIDNALEVGKEFSHVESRLPVVVQKFIRSKQSGVALSIDPTTGAKRIVVEINNGIGESVVGGEATPDLYEVDRDNPNNIVHRRLGAKGVQTTSVEGGTESVKADDNKINTFAGTDAQIIEVAKDVVTIKEKLGKEVDTEFGFDEEGNINWYQARDETVGSRKKPHIVEMREKKVSGDNTKNAELLLEAGIIGCPGAASGKILIADTVKEANKILELEENKGQDMILVTKMTTPDWVPIMKKVKGIITEHGGRTCHAAIVSRELGTPCLVGIEKQIEVLRKGDSDFQYITLDVRDKKVYKGKLPLEEIGENIDSREIKNNPTRTKVKINISIPDEAKKMHALSELGKEFGIALLRVEFLLKEIGVHVNALVDFDKGNLKPELHKKVAEKLAEKGYTSGKEYFIGILSEGIADIVSNFPDSEAIIRTTDFKTNEYKDLLGGQEYENVEDNPMMGWRGLVRSLAPENRDGFKWELEAIKRVRDMGYKKVKIMFPMVRDPKELIGGEELDAVGFKGAYEIMKEVGLERGKDDLKVGIMIEDETNIERLDEYIDSGIDFGSIGSNDLTQLVLATDRDGEKIQKIPWYGEMNPAVIRKVKRAIRACKERGIDIGICGDAPSSNPEIVKILVEEGINSIGVTPNAYLSAYRLVRREEEKKKQMEGIGETIIYDASLETSLENRGNGKGQYNAQIPS